MLDTVQSSGFFSQVGDAPAPNGAILQVTINNVPINGDMNDAYQKGFITGFTFGLVGNTVGDGYLCTVDYVSGPNAQKISKSVRDAIWTSVGATSGPQHARKVSSIDEAAKIMTHKCVGNALNDVAKDPAFSK